jgi:TonB family protein
MTPIKGSAELAGAPAASESTQTKGRSKPESPHMRADAVSLEVAVKVHGSLLPSVSPGAGPGGIGQAQPFEEQTSTMIVFPQGSVLKMSTAVSAGQVMVLTNLKSRQDAICRVVKVRAYGAGQSYVEIEFTSPQPGYWGVYFPTDGPEVARMPKEQPAAAPVASGELSAPPVPQSVAPSIESVQQASPVAPAPAAPVSKLPEPAPMNAPVEQSPSPAPRLPVAPKLPESSFASIGTKEEVLASADATRERRTTSWADTSAKPSPSVDREVSAAIDALIAPAPKTVATPRPEPRESAATTRISAKAVEPHSAQAEARLPTPKQMFGVTLDSAAPTEKLTGKLPREGSNKLWIGIGIAAAIAVAAGGAYYFRSRPSSNAIASAPPAVASVSTTPAQPAIAQPPAAPAPSQTTDAGQAVSDQPASQPAALESRDVAPATDAVTDEAPRRKSSFDAVDSSPKRRELEKNKQEASAKPQSSVAIPSAFGALNTRPVVANHEAAASAGAAPALNASAGPIAPTGSLPGIAPPPPSVPVAPKPVSNAPIRVGGKILPPRLVSSVLPVYPEIAQQARVTGTVVIDTTVDKNGNVVKMRVITGPELLRGAALSALRQWKYQPSKLDGEPITVEMIVSIQFH